MCLDSHREVRSRM